MGSRVLLAREYEGGLATVRVLFHVLLWLGFFSWGWIGSC
jgi:hypothetical protein